jgi:hypothetical protein
VRLRLAGTRPFNKVRVYLVAASNARTSVDGAGSTKTLEDADGRTAMGVERTVDGGDCMIAPE